MVFHQRHGQGSAYEWKPTGAPGAYVPGAVLETGHKVAWSGGRQHGRHLVSKEAPTQCMGYQQDIEN